jgi:hypothetical protein
MRYQDGDARLLDLDFPDHRLIRAGVAAVASDQGETDAA